MAPEDIERRFTFHAPATEEKREAHGSVRQGCRELAAALNELLPEGDEKLTAIRKLEEVMFWSNAALARHPS
jgi:hypothetical protein